MSILSNIKDLLAIKRHIDEEKEKDAVKNKDLHEQKRKTWSEPERALGEYIDDLESRSEGKNRPSMFSRIFSRKKFASAELNPSKNPIDSVEYKNAIEYEMQQIDGVTLNPTEEGK